MTIRGWKLTNMVELKQSNKEERAKILQQIYTVFVVRYFKCLMFPLRQEQSIWV